MMAHGSQIHLVLSNFGEAVVYRVTVCVMTTAELVNLLRTQESCVFVSIFLSVFIFVFVSSKAYLKLRTSSLIPL